MCDAGRIRHHLKRWLWQQDATVLLVGFQAQGTLGRFLDDGAKAVRIQGEEIKVAARIRSIDDYSGHADGPELARWIAARRPIRARRVPGPWRRAGARRACRSALPSGRYLRRKSSFRFSTTSMSCQRRRRRRSTSPHRRRLAPEAVVALDWHNDMSKLILDINDRIEAAADDRARGVIIRKLRRALEAND